MSPPSMKRTRPKRRDEAPRITGLMRRGNRAYWHRFLPEGVGGDRIYNALEADFGSDLATTRAGAVNTLYDRGDWGTLRRWAAGDVHISRIVTAVRDGDWGALLTLNPDGVLLKQSSDDFLQRIEATSAAATYRQYRSTIAALIAELGEDYEMHRLTVKDAEAILHKPRIEQDDELVPWSAQSQQNNRAKASAFWKYVIDRQAEESEQKKMLPLLTRNPWRGARIKKARKKRPPVLDAPRMRALLTNPAVEGTPTACMLALGLLAGLRQGEILNLRRADLFLDDPAPFLRVQEKAGKHEWETKTERSQRDVPMPAALASIVRAHIASGFAGERYLITAGGRDNPINSSTSDRWTELAFEAAGIRYGRKKGDGLTIHHTRHSYATMLLSQGVSIAVVAELLGDKQETVLDTYSHALPNDRLRAVQLLETVL